MDEGEDLNKEVAESQQDHDYIDFVCSEREEDQELFQGALEETNEQTIPPNRRDFLPAANPDGVKRLWAAFGLSGHLGRTRVQEAAKSQATLVRQSIILRRLVLRYVKAFILLVVTSIVLLSMSAVVQMFVFDPSRAGQFTLSDYKPLRLAPSEQLMGIVGLFLAWAAIAPVAVTQPIAWIYSRGGHMRRTGVKRDPHLVFFEHRVIYSSVAVVALQVVIVAMLFGERVPGVPAPDQSFLAAFIASLLFVLGVDVFTFLEFMRPKRIVI